MEHRDTPAQTPGRWRAAALLVVAPFLTAPYTGSVTHYRINGHTVISGTTAEELVRIAGEPLSIETPPSRYFERHWEYRCRRAGTGPCRTVAEPGKRRMIVVMEKDRLDRVFFEPVRDDD